MPIMRCGYNLIDAMEEDVKNECNTLEFNIKINFAKERGFYIKSFNLILSLISNKRKLICMVVIRGK